MSISDAKDQGLFKVLHYFAMASIGVVVGSVLLGIFIDQRPATPQYTSFFECYQQTGDPKLCQTPLNK